MLNMIYAIGVKCKHLSFEHQVAVFPSAEHLQSLQSTLNFSVGSQEKFGCMYSYVVNCFVGRCVVDRNRGDIGKAGKSFLKHPLRVQAAIPV